MTFYVPCQKCGSTRWAHRVSNKTPHFSQEVWCLDCGHWLPCEEWPTTETQPKTCHPKERRTQ